MDEQRQHQGLQTADVGNPLVISDPKKLIKNASEIAKQFNQIVQEQQLFTKVGASTHVHVAGWSMLGVLLGVFPSAISTESVETKKTVKSYLVEKPGKNGGTYKKWVGEKDLTDEKILDTKEVPEVKYRAEMALKTVNGLEVCRALSTCSNAEKGKLFNEDYALESMAITRCTGKAFRLAFSWIVTMAGYDATPFEEIENMAYEDNTRVGPTAEASEKMMQKLEVEIDKVANALSFERAKKLLANHADKLTDEHLNVLRDRLAAKAEEVKKNAKTNAKKGAASKAGENGGSGAGSVGDGKENGKSTQEIADEVFGDTSKA